MVAHNTAAVLLAVACIFVGASGFYIAQSPRPIAGGRRGPRAPRPEVVGPARATPRAMGESDAAGIRGTDVDDPLRNETVITFVTGNKKKLAEVL